MPMFLRMVEMEATMDWNEEVPAVASSCQREATNSKTDLTVRSSLLILKSLGAEEGTRTPTPLRVRGPEPRASANSATSARETCLAA